MRHESREDVNPRVDWWTLVFGWLLSYFTVETSVLRSTGTRELGCSGASAGALEEPWTAGLMTGHACLTGENRRVAKIRSKQRVHWPLWDALPDKKSSEFHLLSGFRSIFHLLSFFKTKGTRKPALLRKYTAEVMLCNPARKCMDHGRVMMMMMTEADWKIEEKKKDLVN